MRDQVVKAASLFSELKKIIQSEHMPPKTLLAATRLALSACGTPPRTLMRDPVGLWDLSERQLTNLMHGLHRALAGEPDRRGSIADRRELPRCNVRYPSDPARRVSAYEGRRHSDWPEPPDMVIEPGVLSQ